MEPKIDIPSIKLSDVERILASVRRSTGENDADLSFEFILMAFFPTCWDNIKQELNRQYTLGFIAGGKQEKKSSEPFKENDECYND
jgi:hypothetical protein